MPAILLSNQSVLLTAFKKCENKKGFILRFFETQGENTHTTLDIPICGIHCTLSFTAFEIKTMWLQDDKKTLQEVPLLEDDVYYQC